MQQRRLYHKITKEHSFINCESGVVILFSVISGVVILFSVDCLKMLCPNCTRLHENTAIHFSFFSGHDFDFEKKIQSCTAAENAIGIMLIFIQCLTVFNILSKTL